MPHHQVLRIAPPRFGPGGVMAGHGIPESAQVRLAPLLRVEALYLLGQTSVGLVVCTLATGQTRTPGFHAVIEGELIILTPLTPALESTLEDRLPLTYQAESVDDRTQDGWQATFTGPASIVIDPILRRHHRTALPGFEAGPGSRVLRLRPRRIGGHRFQRLNGHGMTEGRSAIE